MYALKFLETAIEKYRILCHNHRRMENKKLILRLKHRTRNDIFFTADANVLLN